MRGRWEGAAVAEPLPAEFAMPPEPPAAGSVRLDGVRLALVTDTFLPQVNGVTRTLDRLARTVEARGGAVEGARHARLLCLPPLCLAAGAEESAPDTRLLRQ